MRFANDFVTRENYWQIASLVTQKYRALFYISTPFCQYLHTYLCMNNYKSFNMRENIFRVFVTETNWSNPTINVVTEPATTARNIFVSGKCLNCTRLQNIHRSVASDIHVFSQIWHTYFHISKLNCHKNAIRFVSCSPYSKCTRITDILLICVMKFTHEKGFACCQLQLISRDYI